MGSSGRMSGGRGVALFATAPGEKIKDLLAKPLRRACKDAELLQRHCYSSGASNAAPIRPPLSAEANKKAGSERHRNLLDPGISMRIVAAKSGHRADQPPSTGTIAPLT